MISRYISSKEKMDFLRKNIEAIPEAQIREVARDTLLKGIPVMNLTWKYGLCNFTQIFYAGDRWGTSINRKLK